MNLDDFLSRLKGVRACPDGSHDALCPAHDDRKPSLHVTKGEDGRILLFCHAGCTFEKILAAMGLEKRDLFPPRPEAAPAPGSRKPVIIKTYDYQDESGKLLYQVCRLDPKGFRQRRPDPDKPGKWLWKMTGIRRVPYCLPRLLKAATKDLPIFVVEGEKDADNLNALGFAATTNAGGAGKWLDDFAQYFKGARVVILPDNDPPGRKHARQVARTLSGVAENIKIIELPDLPAKGDVSDWLAAGGSREALLDMAEKAAPWEPGKTGVQAEQNKKPGRLTIQTNDKFLRETVAEAVSALVTANEPPTIFIRGTELARVPAGADHADLISVPMIRVFLDQAADFFKLTFTKDGDPKEVPARPPRDVCESLLALPAKEFPQLAGIRTAPVFLPDGRLLAQDGYDKSSGLLLRMRGLAAPAVDMPVDEALDLLLRDLLGDFPFAGESGKAHALALLFQPFVRDLICGPTPLFLIDAPLRGAGKGLLAAAICTIATGRTADVMTLVRTNPEEHEKRITSLLLAGAQFILIDNAGVLSSEPLAAVLTATRWRGRRLGKSEMVEVQNDAAWVATGNNVQLSDEITRRAIPIRLDPGLERPEERTGFRHPDLLSWTGENRGRLVSACISLVNAWIKAGSPRGTATLGSYESWARILGGILTYLRVPGFLGGREQLYTEADRETGDWRALCKAWFEIHGEHPVTAKDIFVVAKEHELLLNLWGGRSALAAQQRFGHALAGARDRVFGGYRIKTAGRDSATGNAAYQLTRVTGGACKTPETPETLGLFSETGTGKGFQAAGSAGVLNSRAGVSGVSNSAAVISRKSGSGVSGVLNSDPLKTPVGAGSEKPDHKRLTGTGSGVPGVSGVLQQPPAAREISII